MKDFMNKLLLSLLLLSGVCWGQVSYVAPQSVVTKDLITSVSGSKTSGCITNVGQNVHIANYRVLGTPTALDVRLEYSFDSDSATCITGHWFPLSDDGSDVSGSGGSVVGIGAYPFIRAKVVACGGCNGTTVSVNISYSGSSASPLFPTGFYNPSQQVRKIAFSNVNQSGGAGATGSCLLAPYGSTGGFFLLTDSGAAVPATSTVSILAHTGAETSSVGVFSTPLTFDAGGLVIPLPGSPASCIDVTFSPAANFAGSVTGYVYFYPPGQTLPPPAQPPTTLNSENLGAPNSQVQVTISRANDRQRSHLFMVNARCSAGSAQLTVQDGSGGLNLFSTAATEVGTTSFFKEFNPGLVSSPGNNLVITLGTCGVANSGTLDVQGSVF